MSGDKGATDRRRGERTGVAGEATIALSTLTSMLRSIRNGLRSLPLGRTRALMAMRSEWPLRSLALSGCSVPLVRRKAVGTTSTSALVRSPKYTWPQVWSVSGLGSSMVGLSCLWVATDGAESFLLATAPTLLACDGDMPDNSIDLVSWAMLCRLGADGEANNGVLGAVRGSTGVLDRNGLSIVSRLTLVDIDCSAMGDRDLVSPPQESRLSTIALSCCLIETS